jgi:hypothetical protein
MGWVALDRINLALHSENWRADANTVLDLTGSFKCGEILDQLSDCISF